MNVYDFTKPELEHIKELANFTPDEEKLFWLRSKNISLLECAEQMDISVATAYRINSKMKSKIIRVCDLI